MKFEFLLYYRQEVISKQGKWHTISNSFPLNDTAYTTTTTITIIIIMHTIYRGYEHKNHPVKRFNITSYHYVTYFIFHCYIPNSCKGKTKKVIPVINHGGL
jgi:hypothetical protein